MCLNKNKHIDPRPSVSDHYLLNAPLVLHLLYCSVHIGQDNNLVGD